LNAVAFQAADPKLGMRKAGFDDLPPGYYIVELTYNKTSRKYNIIVPGGN